MESTKEESREDGTGVETTDRDLWDLSEHPFNYLPTRDLDPEKS